MQLYFLNSFFQFSSPTTSIKCILYIFILSPISLNHFLIFIFSGSCLNLGDFFRYSFIILSSVVYYLQINTSIDFFLKDFILHLENFYFLVYSFQIFLFNSNAFCCNSSNCLFSLNISYIVVLYYIFDNLNICSHLRSKSVTCFSCLLSGVFIGRWL